MSAARLREAAALMRSRAEVATGGPWMAFGHTVEGAGTVYFDKHALSNDAEHIASWHPAVALAVADWLEAAAQDREDQPYLPQWWDELALAVANAYLGGDS